MSATDARLAAMQPSSATGARIPRADLPPGPRWPALAQTIAFSPLRHRFLPAMHRRYGDTFTVRTLPRMTFVMVSKPADVREVFAGDPAVFHAGKGNGVLGPVMGQHSLLLQDTDEHKRARRLLMPAFAARALDGYAGMVAEIAAAEAERWEPGVPFRALERMNALTLDVILRVVFGVTDEDRLAELRPPVERTVAISPVVLMGWGYPRLQRLGLWKRAVANQRELDRVMFAEIAERRAATDLGSRSDVLSRLLTETPEGEGLDDVELRDQLVTLLLAGHETTASALSWALHELAGDRVLHDRARAAARDGDDGYLEAVLKEAMRLHPVIPMVVRQLVEPATIGGWDLPAGVFVAPSIILAHANGDAHPEPERFRPERFLEGEVAPNTWIPFGGGVRRCIGAGFSLMEGVVVLREVLRRYDVSRPPRTRERPKVRNITTVPAHGARIVVTPAR
ncbi:MAG: cytochrome P450 [Nocardioides sp.]|nr:cytochrome P450 [Nocardioides sp.]